MNEPIEWIRYAADQALAVPNLLQMRPYYLTIYNVSWDGARQGVGNKTTTTIPIVNDGYVNARFRQVSKEDIVLSGGFLSDKDDVIGPICFPYVVQVPVVGFPVISGGIDPISFSTPSLPNAELYLNIQGPNFPEGGSFFKKIYDQTDKNVMFRIYLRATDIIQ